jgi:hypothetical protein
VAGVFGERLCVEHLGLVVHTIDCRAALGARATGMYPA